MKKQSPIKRSVLATAAVGAGAAIVASGLAVATRHQSGPTLVSVTSNEFTRPQLSWSAPFATVERYGTRYELTADRFLGSNGDSVAVTLTAQQDAPTLALRLQSVTLRRTPTTIQRAATLARTDVSPGKYPIQVLNDAGLGGNRLSMATDAPLAFGQYEIDVELQDAFTSEIVTTTFPVTVGLAQALPGHVVEHEDSRYRVLLTPSGRNGENVMARVSVVGEPTTDPDPAHQRLDAHAVVGYLSVSGANGVEEEAISSRALSQDPSNSTAPGWALVTGLNLEPGQHVARFELRDATTNELIDRVSTTIDVPVPEITYSASGPSSLSL